MSFKKKIASHNIEPINDGLENFCQGTKFSREGELFIVSEEMESDNTQQRRIVSTTTGVQEILTLKQLQNDLRDGIIKPLDKNSKI